MMNIVVPSIKSVLSKVYNWFNKADIVTPDKLEVVSTYFVLTDVDEKPKVRKKRLTRMRVIKRTKEVNNEL